jgi:hypothetical protein
VKVTAMALLTARIVYANPAHSFKIEKNEELTLFRGWTIVRPDTDDKWLATTSLCQTAYSLNPADRFLKFVTSYSVFLVIESGEISLVFSARRLD